MTDEEVIQRGRESLALLENKAVLEALDRLARRITQDWRAASTSAPTLQVQLHAQVAAIDAVVAMLRRDVEDAEFVKAKLAKAPQRTR